MRSVEAPETVGMNARRLERVGPAMQAYVDRGVYAGVSTLIARRGIVVHAGQFGWRDKEARSPMTADTILRLYSMTKPIVCTALMTLYEEGRFQLVDPLAKYIPDFARVRVLDADGKLVDPIRPIFVGDLMTHTSGLTYHFLEDSPVSRMYARGKLLDPQHPARRRDRRPRAVPARLPARIALSVQRGHRRRGPADRSDLRPAARRVPPGAAVRAARHGRHGLRRRRRKSGSSCGHVWPAGSDRSGPDDTRPVGSLAKRLQRTRRRLGHLPGRRSRGFPARRARLVRDDRRLFPLRPDAGQWRPVRRRADPRTRRPSP